MKAGLIPTRTLASSLKKDNETASCIFHFLRQMKRGFPLLFTRCYANTRIFLLHFFLFRRHSDGRTRLSSARVLCNFTRYFPTLRRCVISTGREAFSSSPHPPPVFYLFSLCLSSVTLLARVFSILLSRIRLPFFFSSPQEHVICVLFRLLFAFCDWSLTLKYVLRLF